MEFKTYEWEKILKYLYVAKDHTTELYEAMKDIETYGEVDHDGMPVVNSIELKNDIEQLEEFIKKIKNHNQM